MQTLMSYLGRKQKITLRLVCKSFGEAIALKSLVNLRLTGTDIIKKSSFFKSCVTHTRKVSKLHFEDVNIDLEYLNIIEKMLGVDSKE